MENLMPRRRRNTLRSKFTECSKDSKKLHSQWPILWLSKHLSYGLLTKLDEQLAEEFADFFEDKIAKIRQALSDKPKYKTTKDTIPRFTNFALMTESQVLKAINSLKSK